MGLKLKKVGFQWKIVKHDKAEAKSIFFCTKVFV